MSWLQTKKVGTKLKPNGYKVSIPPFVPALLFDLMKRIATYCNLLKRTNKLSH